MMPDTREHFQGLLANVDPSILRVDFADGFIVSERDSAGVWEVFPGLPKWEAPRDKGYVVERDATVHGPIIAGESDCLKLLLRKLSLLRLCKEGNPRLVVANYEFNPGGYGTAYYPTVPDLETFSVNDAQATDATNLLATIKQPFEQREVQLAFDNFQLSFEVRNWNLAFLTLSIALEVLLSDGDQDKAYKVSRNAAVLLSSDKETGQYVFDDMKHLYNLRSRLVHSGRPVTREEVIQFREHVRGILRRVIDLGLEKKALLCALDAAGFGEPLIV